MIPKQSHSFKRDDAARQYVLTVVHHLPTQYRFDFHQFSGKAAIAMAHFTDVSNIDRAALNGLAEYTTRLDRMIDDYHEAPLWKRIWWALTNDLPFVYKVE